MDKIERFGYDPKQLHHILRLDEFMSRWLDGEPYEDCLLSKKADYLKQIKFGCLSKDEAVETADRYVSAMKSVKTKYMEEHEYFQYQNIDAKDNWEWCGIKEDRP